MIQSIAEVLKKIGHSFALAPFASILQPIIEDVLVEHKKDECRKGTILTPLITVWLTLALTLRRDFNYHKTLNWMISGFRWKSLNFPPKLVKDGAISHARSRMGVAVFRDIFNKFVARSHNINPDFHGWITAMFDGTSMTMPDTKSNQDSNSRTPRKGALGHGLKSEFS